MLEIEKVTNLPDGRSVIKTHGGRRFKVNSRGMRDGYNISRVEFIADEEIKGMCQNLVGRAQIRHFEGAGLKQNESELVKKY